MGRPGRKPHLFEGKTYPELAVIYGITSNAIYHRIRLHGSPDKPKTDRKGMGGRKPLPDISGLVKRKEVAKRLGVSTSTVYILCNKGILIRSENPKGYIVESSIQIADAYLEQFAFCICGNRKARTLSETFCETCKRQPRKEYDRVIYKTRNISRIRTKPVKTIVEALQDSRKPMKDIVWMRWTDAMILSGLNSIQFNYLRNIKALTVIPDISRKNRAGQPVSLYAEHEMLVIRELKDRT